MYWELGKILSEKVKNNEWGKSVVTEFAKYITSNAPDIKGFSDKNLWRMKQFYETYVDHPELSALLREIPWTHNTIIFSRCKSTEERICEKMYNKSSSCYFILTNLVLGIDLFYFWFVN